MNIYRFNRGLQATLLLTALICSCSKPGNSEEEWLYAGADSEGFIPVRFDASLKDMDGDMHISGSSMPDVFQAYGFNVSLGKSVFGKTSSTDPQSVTVTRDSVWNYVDPETGAMINWLSLKKYPISFYALAGDGIAMASIGAKSKLPTLKVELPVDKNGSVSSDKTHDLLFASALRLDPSDYIKDSSDVQLDFQHILPQINLSASLVNANDLEVEVQSATLMGFAYASEFYFNDNAPAWNSYTPEGGAATADIVMSLAKPVKLSMESAALQDHSAYIVPQTVKAWTSAAQKNGAGIKLDARVRSKALGLYLVGSASSYGQVYVPVEDMTFVPNTAYSFAITFNVIYNSDGSIGYRATWKPMVSPWKDKDDNLVYDKN